MPARDRLHDTVKNALVKDGWTITHDPYMLPFGQRKAYADLGAEKTIAAEKDAVKILVEIKSFVGDSEVRDLEEAIGQFFLYQVLLKERDPDRQLFLAMPEESFESLFEDAIGAKLVRELKLSLFTIDQDRQEIVRWQS